MAQVEHFQFELQFFLLMLEQFRFLHCSFLLGDFNLDFGLVDIILRLKNVEQAFEVDYGESKEWLFVQDEIDQENELARWLRRSCNLTSDTKTRAKKRG